MRVAVIAFGKPQAKMDLAVVVDADYFAEIKFRGVDWLSPRSGTGRSV